MRKCVNYIKSYLILSAAFAYIIMVSYAAASENQWILEPAASFGSFQIGQGIEKLEQTLGNKPPDLKKEVQHGYLVKYDKQGIIVQFNGFTKKIQFIGCDKAGFNKISFKTKEGITIGTPRTVVEKYYSTPTKVIPSVTRDFYPKSNEIALYIEKGIAFHYDENNNVVVILVFDPSLFGN